MNPQLKKMTALPNDMSQVEFEALRDVLRALRLLVILTESEKTSRLKLYKAELNALEQIHDKFYPKFIGVEPLRLE